MNTFATFRSPTLLVSFALCASGISGCKVAKAGSAGPAVEKPVQALVVVNDVPAAQNETVKVITASGTHITPTGSGKLIKLTYVAPSQMRFVAGYPQQETTSTTSSIYNIKRDGTSLKVETRNGVTTVEYNGTELPKERFTLNGQQLTIKDEQGTVVLVETLPGLDVAEINLPATALTPGNNVAARNRAIAPEQPWAERNNAPAATTKRVMLGITMESISEDLATFLGLDPEQDYQLIAKITPDSPAAKAGLQRGDVVLMVEDKPAIEEDVVREEIRNKKAGDTIRLTIARKGQELNVTATLAEVEERVSGWSPAMPAIPPMPNVNPQQDAKAWEEYARKWDEFSKTFGLEMEKQGGQWPEQAEALAKRGQELAASAKKRVEEFERAISQGQFPQRIFRATPEGQAGNELVFTVPGVALSDQAAENAKRLKSLEDQSAKLAEQNARLAEQSARLAELMARLEAAIANKAASTPPTPSPTPSPTPPAPSTPNP